jgi:hypothetical protein
VIEVGGNAADFVASASVSQNEKRVLALRDLTMIVV